MTDCGSLSLSELPGNAVGRLGRALAALDGQQPAVGNVPNARHGRLSRSNPTGDIGAGFPVRRMSGPRVPLGRGASFQNLAGPERQDAAA